MSYFNTNVGATLDTTAWGKGEFRFHPYPCNKALLCAMPPAAAAIVTFSMSSP